MAVILINSFEVTKGREDECHAYWQKARDYMARQPGYISTTLHRAVDGHAKFTFVNVARWETAEHFAAVTQSDEFRSIVADGMDTFPHHPGLYTVAFTDAPDDV